MFTGNFLINNITGGSEAITIQTNGGTNEKITIQTLQGNTNDSINIKSSFGGVNISADTDITFSAKDIIMSNSDLSAGDISANNIQALGYITTAGAVQGVTITDGIATLNAGALTGLTTVTATGDVSANNFILNSGGGGNLSDLSNNVTLLDASMAIVEQTGFIRMRSNSQFLIENSSSWIDISLNQQDSVFGSSITHSGTTEFKIITKGIYSYSIQLGLTATGQDFSVNNLELALTNNGGGGSSSFDPANSGSNGRGGFNKEFSEYYNMNFSSGDKCFISGNGIGQFNSDDRLKIFVKWNKTNPIVTRQFDINDPSGTIVTFALIQALE